MERNVVALAVHLGRRRDDDQLLLLVRVLQDDFRAVDVGLDGVHRLLDDQLDPHRRGEMEDDVAAIDELGEQRLVVDRIDEVLEPLTSLQMGDVLDRAGRQVVEHQDLMAACEQRVGEVRPDESGATGDERAHVGQFGRWPRRASATAATAARIERGCSGSDTTRAHASSARGQSAGGRSANAGCRWMGIG